MCLDIHENEHRSYPSKPERNMAIDAVLSLSAHFPHDWRTFDLTQNIII